MKNVSIIKTERVLVKVSTVVKYRTGNRQARSAAIRAAKKCIGSGLAGFGAYGEFRVGNAVELKAHVPRHLVAKALVQISEKQSIADRHELNTPNSFQSGKVAGLIEARNIIQQLLECAK